MGVGICWLVFGCMMCGGSCIRLLLVAAGCCDGGVGCWVWMDAGLGARVRWLLPVVVLCSLM